MTENDPASDALPPVPDRAPRSLLAELRERQDKSLTARIARRQSAPSEEPRGAFNAEAAAALSQWRGE